MLDITVRGGQQLAARLARLGPQVMAAAAAGLRMEAEIEMTEAKERTPFRFGHLRGSGRVHEVAHTAGGGLSVTMSFGGPAAPYAGYVHENLEAQHAEGTQAKFLESVVLESRPYMAARVARRIGLSLR